MIRTVLWSLSTHVAAWTAFHLHRRRQLRLPQSTSTRCRTSPPRTWWSPQRRLLATVNRLGLWEAADILDFCTAVDDRNYGVGKVEQDSSRTRGAAVRICQQPAAGLVQGTVRDGPYFRDRLSRSAPAAYASRPWPVQRREDAIGTWVWVYRCGAADSPGRLVARVYAVHQGVDAGRLGCTYTGAATSMRGGLTGRSTRRFPG
jgi:hypothetical protein